MPKFPITHKFKSKITIRDGLKFRSKKEAEFYDELKLLQKSGEVLFFLRQPMFDLPGGIRVYADFIVFYSDGMVKIYDVKGKKTTQYVRNKKLVEASYPVEIIER